MTMKTLHTPGSWKVSKDGNDIETDINQGIATLYAVSETQDKANAKLIAAAPEMLKALIKAKVCLVHTLDSQGKNVDEEDMETYLLLDSIIKKATE